MLKEIINDLIPIILIGMTGVISFLILWLKFYLIELYKVRIRGIKKKFLNKVVKYI